MYLRLLRESERHAHAREQCARRGWVGGVAVELGSEHRRQRRGVGQPLLGLGLWLGLVGQPLLGLGLWLGLVGQPLRRAVRSRAG